MLVGRVHDSEHFTVQDAHLGQSAAFCFAMRHFSPQPPNSNPESIEDLFDNVLWARTTNPYFKEHDNDNGTRTVAIQHTSANRAAGFFCAYLRSKYTKTGLSHGWWDLLIATTLPLSNYSRLPQPFARGSLQDFCKAHLHAMALLNFFTGDEWTGCYRVGGPFPDPFHPIGGVHRDGFDRPDRSAPPGYYPHGRSFESVVRFRCTDEQDSMRFQLQSNNFHSEAGLHRLRVEVNRETGQLRIYHWHPTTEDFMTTEGMITPFGIESSLMIGNGAWLWLWKVAWSAADYYLIGRAPSRITASGKSISGQT